MSSTIFRYPLPFLFLIFLFPYLPTAQNLTDGQIDAISARLAESAAARFVLALSDTSILSLTESNHFQLGTRYSFSSHP